MSRHPAAHTLFISDLHLSEQRPDISEAFVQFCENRAARAEAFYILGDLADAWLGDDDDSAIAELLRTTLSALTRDGVRVFIINGNRDFLMGRQFGQDTGCTILDEPAVIDLYGEQVLLMHGDSLCTRDTEYMAFREQIRNPDMQQMLLAKSLDERRGIAKMLRENSKSANATKASDIMDVTPEEVQAIMQQQGVTTMIHGHTHRPDVHQLTLPVNNQDQPGEAKRYVLGDWDTVGWCITASEQGLTLESFAL